MVNESLLWKKGKAKYDIMTAFNVSEKTQALRRIRKTRAKGASKWKVLSYSKEKMIDTLEKPLRIVFYYFGGGRAFREKILRYQARNEEQIPLVLLKGRAPRKLRKVKGRTAEIVKVCLLSGGVYR